ncbi:UNVERIFIED_ORG: COQ9 family protein [Anaplasma ovis]|uniref:COQ9 family protein n=1 Tax=Anaplasma marginale TaxID=770 RepID=UPI0001B46596
MEHTTDASHSFESHEVRRISDEAISLIPHMGVSDETLREACKRLGLENSFCKFHRGIYDVLEYFHEELIDSITSSFQSKSPDELPRVRDKVGYLLELCILYNASLPNSRQLVKSVLRFALLPHNTCFFASLVFKVMDTVWHLAGDSATNFSYYTKRWTAGSVYISSLVYLVRDSSEDASETLSFMHRRIESVIALQKLKNSARNMLPRVLKVFDARFD